jgi:hypothetical protein
VAKKEIAVKKYVVKLSAEERTRLEALIHAGIESGTNGDEGAHPAKGRRFRGGRMLEGSVANPAGRFRSVTIAAGAGVTPPRAASAQ